MSIVILLFTVFVTNDILPQLTVKHLCEGTGQGYQNKSNNTSSALFAHLRFSISTDTCANILRPVNLQTCANTKTFATHLPSLMLTYLQVSLACQLTNIGQCKTFAHTLHDTLHALTNTTLSAKRTNFLNEISSVQSLLKQHASH